MRICFQSDLKDCPDLRHAGQRLLSVNPISDNPGRVEIVMEGIPQSLSQFTQQLQSVNPKKESLLQVMNCSSIHHELHEIAMNLSRETSDPVEWILAAMAFLQERIVYDPGLAQAYDQGKKTGLTLSEAWVKRKGTCREITMAMAGLCHAQGIPVRFVQGISAPDRLHVWNEVYLEPLGWLSVDAQAGMIGQWGSLISLRLADKIEDLPMPHDVKIKVSQTRGLYHDRQVYLKLNRLSDEAKGSGQFLLKQWTGETGIRCLLHLTSQREPEESLESLSNRVFMILRVFLNENSMMKLDGNFNAAALQKLESLCDQLENSGIRTRLAAGLNSLSQTAAVWVEAAVSETLWAKLDLAGKTLDYKPEWIRLVQARSAVALIQKLQETIGS